MSRKNVGTTFKWTPEIGRSVELTLVTVVNTCILQLSHYGNFQNTYAILKSSSDTDQICNLTVHIIADYYKNPMQSHCQHCCLEH